TGAVPTVWIAVKELCEAEGWNISSLRTIAIGGSAAPKHLQLAYKNQFGVVMSHAWGMTEMTPLGTIGRLKSYMRDWPEGARYDVRARVGYPSVCVDIRVVDDAGQELPWDGTSMGELQVRGPGCGWIRRRSSTTSGPGSPSGRCRTRSRSSTRSPRRASASSTRRCCAGGTRTGRRGTLDATHRSADRGRAPVLTSRRRDGARACGGPDHWRQHRPRADGRATPGRAARQRLGAGPLHPRS